MKFIHVLHFPLLLLPFIIPTNSVFAQDSDEEISDTDSDSLNINTLDELPPNSDNDEDESEWKENIDSTCAFAPMPTTLPVDSLKSESDSMIVRRYRNGWCIDRVNPYKFPVDSIKDTFTVDCRGFFPPNINVVTSECGERWGRFHAGTDMRLAIGDPIHATFDGKVRIAKYGHPRRGYGYYVVLQHPNGLETVYGHLSKILVEKGQDVHAGDTIALGGNTGRSTGPHLHFEFRFIGNPINTRNLLEISPDTMYMKGETYVIRPKESFKEYHTFIHHPPVFHKVKQGDVLGKIARRYHTSVAKICKLNKGLKPTTILRLGRRIRVR